MKSTLGRHFCNIKPSRTENKIKVHGQVCAENPLGFAQFTLAALLQFQGNSNEDDCGLNDCQESDIHPNVQGLGPSPRTITPNIKGSH